GHLPIQPPGRATEGPETAPGAPVPLASDQGLPLDEEGLPEVRPDRVRGRSHPPPAQDGPWPHLPDHGRGNRSRVNGEKRAVCIEPEVTSRMRGRSDRRIREVTSGLDAL